MGITAGSREVPGRNACDKRHTYRIIIITNRLILLREIITVFYANQMTYVSTLCAQNTVLRVVVPGGVYIWPTEVVLLLGCQ